MSASSTLFSVLVQCHGEDRYLARAIESLWAQSFEDFEIIAVDDGTADGADNPLDTLVARSPRPMRVMGALDRDAPVALNAAAAMATSRYLAFLDDADAYRPDRLDAVSRVVRKADRFAWGFSGVEPIDESGTPLATADLPDPGIRSAIQRSRAPLDAVRGLPYENTMVANGNLVVEAGLFRDLGGFRNLRFTYAWDLALRLLDLGAPFVVERPLYQHRIHAPATDDRHAADERRRLVARESLVVISEHQERMAVRPRFTPLIAAAAGRERDLDADDAWAVTVTLWALAKLRRIPPAYAAVRNAARVVRSSRRLWSRRR